MWQGTVTRLGKRYMGQLRQLAALFVETDGCYFGLPGVDPWDIGRDAREYDGPHPVVAHPPCGPWGALKQLCRRQQDAACGPVAVAAVRRFGGVLEHPERSGLWAHCGLPLPGHSDKHGFTIQVD